MGRTLKSKYQVRMKDAAGRVGYTAASWRCDQAGRPSVANLAKYVAMFEASTQPGGCNEHLGPSKIGSAEILTNDYDAVIVATYVAKE